MKAAIKSEATEKGTVEPQGPLPETDNHEETRRIPMTKKKLIIAAGVVVLALTLLLVIGANLLVSAALVPSFMRRLEAFQTITEDSVAALVHTDDITANQQEAYSETEQWLETADASRLTAETEDGYRLVAEEFHPRQESSRWVLLLHGYTGWKEAMYPIAMEYVQRGFHALVPDMRCQGESEGDFIGMGWTDRLDNRIWISHILEENPDAEIVIQGQSMGAACALLMTGEELPDNVKAVVSDCAYTDAYEMFKKQMGEWFHLPSFPLLPVANLMLQLRGGYDLKNAAPIRAVTHSRIPTLFIHGLKDQMIDPQMTRDLYAAASCPKQLLLVEGAGHAQSQDKDPELYYGTIFDLLAQYL